MIFGIGMDLLRLERMQKAHRRHGERLEQRLLMPEELRELHRRKNPARRLAMSFAVKEAFVKALGTGFHGVRYVDAGVVHEKSGKPVLVYSARMSARLSRLGIVAGHVSLTDEGGLIGATVVLESAPPKRRARAASARPRRARR